MPRIGMWLALAWPGVAAAQDTCGGWFLDEWATPDQDLTVLDQKAEPFASGRWALALDEDGTVMTLPEPEKLEQLLDAVAKGRGAFACFKVCTPLGGCLYCCSDKVGNGGCTVVRR